MLNGYLIGPSECVDPVWDNRWGIEGQTVLSDWLYQKRQSGWETSKATYWTRGDEIVFPRVDKCSLLLSWVRACNTQRHQAWEYSSRWKQPYQVSWFRSESYLRKRLRYTHHEGRHKLLLRPGDLPRLLLPRHPRGYMGLRRGLILNGH